MPTKSDFLKVIIGRDIDEDKGRRVETADLPIDGSQCQTNTLRGPFIFRPLTDDEKNEFMKSLDTKGKRLLDELMGKSVPSKTTAA